MKTVSLLAVLALSIAGAPHTLVTDALAAARVERVKFDNGALSATIDATQKGSADVDYLVRAMKTCDAGAIRRRADGTATIEVRGSNGVVRRILFVAGKPVVSDAAVTVLSFTREGDATIVKVGEDERYDVPDAFLRGA